jgi:hypothetical protein
MLEALASGFWAYDPPTAELSNILIRHGCILDLGTTVVWLSMSRRV